jgi:hypothetical protein
MGWEFQPPGAGLNLTPLGALSFRVWQLSFDAARAPFGDTGGATERRRLSGVCFLESHQKDLAMLALEIIGGIFVLLFLAAAMTGIEGVHGR